MNLHTSSRWSINELYQHVDYRWPGYDLYDRYMAKRIDRTNSTVCPVCVAPIRQNLVDYDCSCGTHIWVFWHNNMLRPPISAFAVPGPTLRSLNAANEDII